MSTVSHDSPMPSAQRRPFMSIRSMTPTKDDSAPQGSWVTSGMACSRSSIIWTVRSKSAPTRSILFTKQIRGTW